MTFSPRTWTVGEVVSAAQLNQEIRDQFASIFDVWTAYTPTWTASTTNPSLGNGTIVGRSLKVGRTVTMTAQLVVGSTTTFGTGNQQIGLPYTTATVTNGSPGLLDVSITRTGAPNFVIGRIPLGQNSLNTGTIWVPSAVTIGDWDAWTNNAPWTITTGDIVRVYGTYQSAT